ncbi:hypothetical protein Tco_0732200 [Tanacetum coccineum]
MEYYENEDDSFMNFETEYPAIVFDDTSDTTLLCEPTVSPLNNNKIDFKISFNQSDDEDYMDAIRRILGFGIQRIDLLYSVFNCFPAVLWVNGYKLANKASIMELNEDILKIYYSEDQYAVSIKEDTAYPCMHSPKTTKERRSIRRIQRRPIHRIGNIVIKYSEDIKRGPYS